MPRKRDKRRAFCDISSLVPSDNKMLRHITDETNMQSNITASTPISRIHFTNQTNDLDIFIQVTKYFEGEIWITHAHITEISSAHALRKIPTKFSCKNEEKNPSSDKFGVIFYGINHASNMSNFQRICVIVFYTSYWKLNLWNIALVLIISVSASLNSKRLTHVAM